MTKAIFALFGLILFFDLFPIRLSFAEATNALSPNEWMEAQKKKGAWRTYISDEIKAGRGKAQVPILITRLDDPDPDNRQAAALFLCDIGKDAKEATPALTRHIRDPEFEPCLRSIEALGAIGPDASPAIPSLITALSDPTWQIVNMAASSLGDIGPKAQQAVPALEDILQRPKNSDRYASLAVTCRVALARITRNPKPQVQALITMLEEKDDDKDENYPAFEATQGLGELTPASKVALPLICQELVNPNAEFTTREEAARDLGIFGDPQAIPFLQKSIHDDPDFIVRDNAIDVLGKIQGANIDTTQLHKDSQAKEWADTLKGLEPINKKLKPVTSELPPVTSVEVYRLAAYLTGEKSEPQPPKNAELFPMNPDGYTLVVTGKSVLNGSNAEQLADEWRHLTFGVQYQMLCHFPVYGLKFISGQQLLLQTTICWHCSDFSLSDGGYGGFDSSKESSKILRKHLETLLPPIKK